VPQNKELKLTKPAQAMELRSLTPVFGGPVARSGMASSDERALADKGLARLGESPPFSMLPPVAKRIRDARLRLGLTEAQVADRWGVEPSEYWDLELYDSELFSCVDFGKLPALAAALEIPVMVLLFGSPELEPPEVTYAEVAERLRRRMADESLGVDAFSDTVGWELRGVLDDPASLAAFNVSGVYDVCHAVGLDWAGLLVHESRGHRTSGCS
jgi:transcriptional regulator with XRE-family HTH domain